jgi:hypothetical protein
MKLSNVVLIFAFGLQATAYSAFQTSSRRLFGRAPVKQPIKLGVKRHQKRSNRAHDLYASHTCLLLSTSDSEEVQSSSSWEEEDSREDFNEEGEGSAEIKNDKGASKESRVHREFELWMEAIDKAQEALAKKQKSLENPRFEESFFHGDFPELCFDGQDDYAKFVLNADQKKKEVRLQQ